MATFSFLTRLGFVLAGLTTLAFADTVTLKGGTKVVGRILSDTDTEVVIEVQESASIKDERTFQKSEVEKVEKGTADTEIWETLKNYRTGPDSYNAHQYGQMISGLREFVAKFEKNPHAAEAKAKLTDLEAEQARVHAGEMKLNNRWLSQEEVGREQTQITGQLLFNQMKNSYTRGQFSDALNIFDRIEKTTLGSRIYPDAVDLARKILPALRDQVTRRQATLKTEADEQKKTIQLTPEPTKSQIVEMLARQKSQIENSLAAIANLKWLPLNPSNDKSLAKLASTISSETSRLNSVPVEKMRVSIAAAERAQASIKAKDSNSAALAIKEAQSAWPANELVGRLNLQITEMKKAEADALAAKKVAEAEAARAKPKATPTPTPTPKPKPKTVEVVEEITPKPEPAPYGWLPPLIITLVLLAFAGAAFFAYRKYADPENNILDQ